MAENKDKTAEKHKPKEQYLKIPYHILNIRDLGLAEKVLLAHIYSFGKRGCWQSNATLAEVLMTSERTITRLIAAIREFIHVKSPGGYYRTMWAKSHPQVKEAAALWYRGQEITKEGVKGKPDLAKSGEHDGQKRQGESARNGFRLRQECPPTNNKTIKETIKDTTAPPSPLPAGGQAPAVLVERRQDAVRSIEDFKKSFGVARKVREPLSEEQFEQRRQKQKMTLLATSTAEAV